VRAKPGRGAIFEGDKRRVIGIEIEEASASIDLSRLEPGFQCQAAGECVMPEQIFEGWL